MCVAETANNRIFHLENILSFEEAVAGQKMPRTKITLKKKMLIPSVLDAKDLRSVPLTFLWSSVYAAWDERHKHIHAFMKLKVVGVLSLPVPGLPLSVLYSPMLLARQLNLLSLSTSFFLHMTTKSTAPTKSVTTVEKWDTHLFLKGGRLPRSEPWLFNSWALGRDVDFLPER